MKEIGEGSRFSAVRSERKSQIFSTNQNLLQVKLKKEKTKKEKSRTNYEKDLKATEATVTERGRRRGREE